MAIIKTAVDATIAVTAVDTFIYDTRKDSDGGAWRKRTQHTSWYNEELNTATRGSRKEFPTVAVIVAQNALNNGDTAITIYDGDDSSLPMWMVCDVNATDFWIRSEANGSRCLSASNGIILAGQNGTSISSSLLSRMDLLKDRLERHFDGGVHQIGFNTVAERNVIFKIGANGGLNIVSRYVNDVAMAVLPNAPIDAVTGLPVPTIAVATDGGVSVIKDDGTVADKIATAGSAFTKVLKIQFTGNNDISYFHDRGYGKHNNFVIIPLSVWSSDKSSFDHNGFAGFNTTPTLYPTGIGTGSNTDNDYTQIQSLGGDDLVLSKSEGLSVFDINDRSRDASAVAYITSDYNTGWMNGDIKLATLSDTDTTNVVGTELVTNGTFDSNVSGWATSSNGTITWDSGNGGRALVTSTSGGGERAYQVITTVVGQTYTASVYTDSNSNNATPLLYKNGALKVQPPGNYVGWMTHTFVATSTSTTIGIGWNSSVSGYYDNISVRLAEEDRSVNGNGLQVFGTVTKTPVATGADLVGYSGWSEDNYLYNSSIPAFSTGDYFVSTWFKPESNGASYSHLVSIDGQSDSTGVTLKIHHTNGNSVYFYGNATTLVSSAQSLSNGQWYCISGGRVNGVWKLYLNGSLLETGSNNAFGVGGSSTCSLMVGHNPTVGAEFTQGQQALLRVSATFPSDDQIKKMYEDEKTLFQAGTQATLYGTSDAVTALAYDDDTELLHAGTSSGRSVFQGLRRVDNTTTAVGVSISASNSMVLED